MKYYNIETGENSQEIKSGAEFKGHVKKEFSFQGQDLFVSTLIKKSGTFLDIGCGHPTKGSNSKYLESLGWTGILFDDNKKLTDLCREERLNKVYNIDATSHEFIEIVKNYIKSQGDDQFSIDYISLDIEGESVKALEKLLSLNCPFKIMTFEHDSYREGNSRSKPSRKMLRKSGYHLLFKDVCFRWFKRERKLGKRISWEDWWINPNYFSKDIIEAQDKNLYWWECIDKVKNII